MILLEKFTIDYHTLKIYRVGATDEYLAMIFVEGKHDRTRDIRSKSWLEVWQRGDEEMRRMIDSAALRSML